MRLERILASFQKATFIPVGPRFTGNDGCGLTFERTVQFCVALAAHLAFTACRNTARSDVCKPKKLKSYGKDYLHLLFQQIKHSRIASLFNGKERHAGVMAGSLITSGVRFGSVSLVSDSKTCVAEGVVKWGVWLFWGGLRTQAMLQGHKNGNISLCSKSPYSLWLQCPDC